MTFVLLLLCVIALVGLVLVFLTRRTCFDQLHEWAFSANPLYRLTFPKSRKNQKRLLSFIRFFLRSIGVICISTTLLLFCLIWVAQISPFQGDQFDIEAWGEAGSCKGLSDFECVEKEASCLRGGMVSDLTSNYLIPGVTPRDQVTAMLGPSTYQVAIDGEDCPAYSLGMCSGIGIDYDSLFVCYTENDRVRTVGHIQH